MMIKSKHLIGTCFVLLCWANSSLAQQSGLDMLAIGPNAHALGLNQTVSAELLGASSLYTNPANLAFEQHSSLNGTYTLWIGDLDHSNAGVNLRKGSRALAFGFLGSQIDGIPLRGNQPGPPDGTFNMSSISLSGGYAYRLGPVALGVTLQFLHEEFYVYNASGYAANFGAGARIVDGRIQLGASLLNLGEMSELRNEATNLPTTFRTGFDARILTFLPPKNDDLPITVHVKNDWVFPIKSIRGTTQSKPADDIYTNIALEFDVANIIALRTGYRTGDTVRHWSTGASIAVENITINYALIPFETGFGTAHSIGLQYKF